MTRSRPTTRANVTIRSAIVSGCSTTAVVCARAPGMRILPSGNLTSSQTRHSYEWRVWEDVKLPEGKILIPGVIGHYSDFIEHPELVAERLVQYPGLVGRENV